MLIRSVLEALITDFTQNSQYISHNRYYRHTYICDIFLHILGVRALSLAADSEHIESFISLVFFHEKKECFIFPPLSNGQNACSYH